MTRFVFETLEQLERWMLENVTADKYSVFITPANELVCVPRKSTKPLNYGYARLDVEEIKKIKRFIEENMAIDSDKKIRIYYAKVEWDETRAPGSVFTPPV
jgi:hypothetical protein